MYDDYNKAVRNTKYVLYCYLTIASIIILNPQFKDIGNIAIFICVIVTLAVVHHYNKSLHNYITANKLLLTIDNDEETEMIAEFYANNVENWCFVQCNRITLITIIVLFANLFIEPMLMRICVFIMLLYVYINQKFFTSISYCEHIENEEHCMNMAKVYFKAMFFV